MTFLDAYPSIHFLVFDQQRRPGDIPIPKRLFHKVMGEAPQILEFEDMLGTNPPWTSDSLLVLFDGVPELLCLRQIGLAPPETILDLHLWFRMISNGLVDKGETSLPEALAAFDQLSQSEDRIGLSYLADMERLLTCLGDDDREVQIVLQYSHFLPYARKMQEAGLPMDMTALKKLQMVMPDILAELTEEANEQYDVYIDGRLSLRKFKSYLRSQSNSFPRHWKRETDVHYDDLKEMAKVHPELELLKDVEQIRNQGKISTVVVGADGRNRTSPGLFRSKTGRNQPSWESILCRAKPLRSLIKPPPGRSMFSVDFSAEEFGIAAALSGDESMKRDYRSGDVYLAFGAKNRAVPENACKDDYPAERKRFKLALLAIGYGIGARNLARKLDVDESEAKHMIETYRQTYSVYWKWSEDLLNRVHRGELLTTPMGWRLIPTKEMSDESIRNFPLQATASDILRRAIQLAMDAGLRVCASLHDSLWVECRQEELGTSIATCAEAMESASEEVLGGFRLKAACEARCTYPERIQLDTESTTWSILSRYL